MVDSEFFWESAKMPEPGNDSEYQKRLSCVDFSKVMIEILNWYKVGIGPPYGSLLSKGLGLSAGMGILLRDHTIHMQAASIFDNLRTLGEKLEKWNESIIKLEQKE